MASAIIKITAQFNWNSTGFFFHNNDDKGKGHSHCSLVLAPIKLAQSANPPTSEEFGTPTHDEIRDKLAKLGSKSRSKSVLCPADYSSISVIPFIHSHLIMSHK